MSDIEVPQINLEGAAKELKAKLEENESLKRPCMTNGMKPKKGQTTMEVDPKLQTVFEQSPYVEDRSC